MIWLVVVDASIAHLLLYVAPCSFPILLIEIRIMSWRARFSPNIGSVVSFINPKDPACFGVRSWWRVNLPELQRLNPLTLFTIQELNFGEPHMFVSYSPQDQRVIRLAGTTEEEMNDIMQACVTYGTNHAIVERPRTDDGGDPLTSHTVISFGYTDSFLAKLDLTPPADMGQSTPQGVDDPGQKPRVWPRNIGAKIVP